MNKLPREKQALILTLLMEGMSHRAITRAADVSINTVKKLLVDAGEACAKFHDKEVRGVTAELVQCDEIWAFCYAKEKNVASAKAAPQGAGDAWTWTAIDSDTKLLISYAIGDRTTSTAAEFIHDLKDRLVNRVQLTTDGLRAYLYAVEDAFGADVDYAQLVKLYGEDYHRTKRYSPATFTGSIKNNVTGNPDKRSISTSHVERHNLTMRMSMRRFTRLTNAFSKKIENHVYACSLYAVFYNFCRIHQSLRVSPAMEAGLTDRLWDVSDIIDLIEAERSKPKKRGPYKKRISN